MTTALHAERLDAVLDVVRSISPRTVLDLGCGEGDFLLRLAREPGVARIVGVDLSAEALKTLRNRLAEAQAEVREKVELVHGSMMALGAAHAGFDAAVLVESIEHVEPDQLSRVERTVFRTLRPRTVILTTPNADYNPVLGVPAHRFRHPDHRFEWGRAKFQDWAEGVAGRNGYGVVLADIAGSDPLLGGSTQMAAFRAG